ncbi:AgmX/PglI C-terminal domain-containing protein [Pseudenhygromyxa sp. WMMC2535]|uniref:AgmX/PglI C-terminal domain-containing protein n=1 Tax=Pseudenhygromyxa sp. WMMC2535 TaxID=2712867 RepID=UPI001553B6E4|nr:AgmX/PglI C-terminal domain-containing protein [Pseudenhygromyxa sp. WMMC2535]NVB39093.1 AgmX/PglI C-terminal domain-containing protein [Pseudenhygromyxa sp. WMMC2535]
MSAPGKQKVLRVAVIVDGESCEELHQSEPGDIEIVRGAQTGLGIGPSTPLEYGAAAEGKDASTPLALILVGLLMIIAAGGWFAAEVGEHVSENAVLEGPTSEASAGDGAAEGEGAPEKDNTSTIALAVALLGVVPLVTGTSMLRGRRRKRKQALTIYDGHLTPKDYRKRAPLWLGLGAVLVIGGGGLFGYEVSKHDPNAPITEASRGDLSAFKQGEDEGTGGLGLALMLLGLVPGVIGVMGLREQPPKPRKRKPKGGHAPSHHKLFEWAGDEGSYYLVLPPETRGKVALGKNKASVASLRKRAGQPDGDLRVKLGKAARGRLLIGQTRIVFKTVKPARPVKVPVFPSELADPFAHLRLTGLDLAAIGASAGIAGLLAIWFVFVADRTPAPPAERFLKEMGIPASFYEEEKEEPEIEEEEQEDTLEQKDEDLKEDAKEERQLDENLEKPKNVSDKAFREARGVGVARVLGTYGGPGEGTVLDVIESTENNLGELFAQGMTSTEEYRGGEIGDFVAGGGGIESTGTLTKNEALQTGEGPAEVGKTEKKERKVKGKASGSTGDVFGADKKAVAATIQRRMPGLQACYEKALSTNDGLKGKMSFTITINTSGRVSKVDVEVDTINDARVKSCAVAKIKGWRFLVDRDAEESAEVSFSVNFSS